jgi:hypothetical protein
VKGFALRSLALAALVVVGLTGSALGNTPVFSGVPGPITQEATGPDGAVVTYIAPTASDPAVGGSSLDVNCDLASGSTFH